MKRFLMAASAACALLAFTPAFADTVTVQRTENGRPILNLCAGQRGGGYYAAADTIRRQTERNADIRVVETVGSTDNLERLHRGECDLAIFQEDAASVMQSDISSIAGDFTKIRPLYLEVAHLVTRRDSGLTTLDDFLDTSYQIGVVSGSGAHVTLRMLGALNTNYGPEHLRVHLYPDNDTMRDALIDGEISGLFFVGGLGTQFMKGIETQRRVGLFLAHIQVRHSDDSGLYQRVTIDNHHYDRMQGFWDTRTIAVHSILAVRTGVPEAVGRDAWRPFDRNLREVVDAIAAQHETRDLNR